MAVSFDPAVRNNTVAPGGRNTHADAMPVEPTIAQPGDERVFEVFARFDDSSRPLNHVGSVRAGDSVLAWHAARDQYTRREACVDLWVVPRSAITQSSESDLDVLSAAERRGYRQPLFPSAHRRANQPDAIVEADS